ncbi:MAG TPA: hypothetical protein IAA27_08370 [Candidatus Enterococcus stercoravium]|nr:hypothetical protein [Candidatus Enterococcus stercoravium]
MKALPKKLNFSVVFKGFQRKLGKIVTLSNFRENTLKFSFHGGMIPLVIRLKAFWHYSLPKEIEENCRKRGEEFGRKILDVPHRSSLV